MLFYQSLIILVALVVISTTALPLPQMMKRVSQDITYDTVKDASQHNNYAANLMDTSLDSMQDASSVDGEDDEDDEDHHTTTTKTATTTTSSSSSTKIATTTQAPTATTSPTTTTSKPAPTSSNDDDSSSGSSGSHSGRGTWYTPDLGSCGKTNSASEMVVALNHIDMANGSNSNNNPKCGKQIKVSYQGKSATATIVDTCPGCDKGALDLSPAVFEKLATLDTGVITVTWDYI